jgi:hypothetical protein
VKHVFLIFGTCQLLFSDMGTEYCNEILNNVCKIMGIQRSNTIGYRPSSDGAVEKVQASVSSIFAKMIQRNQKDWSESTPFITFAYNTAVQSVTKFSPFYLMFLRDPVTSIDFCLEQPSAALPTDLDEYTNTMLNRMREAYKLVSDQLRCASGRNKRRYDGLGKSEPLSAEERDQVIAEARVKNLNSRQRRIARTQAAPIASAAMNVQHEEPLMLEFDLMDVDLPEYVECGVQHSAAAEIVCHSRSTQVVPEGMSEFMVPAGKWSISELCEYVLQNQNQSTDVLLRNLLSEGSWPEYEKALLRTIIATAQESQRILANRVTQQCQAVASKPERDQPKALTVVKVSRNAPERRSGAPKYCHNAFRGPN